MYTVRELCKLSKLSRSTLLYYDSLGILKPVKRSAANYRLYSEQSLECLRKICMYRDAGVPLTDISKMIEVSCDEDTAVDILEKTLHVLNEQARRIREKQQVVINMIRRRSSEADKGGPALWDDEKHYDELMERMSVFAFDIGEYSGRNMDEY